MPNSHFPLCFVFLGTLSLMACSEPGPELSALEKCDTLAGYTQPTGSFRLVSEIKTEEDDVEGTISSPALTLCQRAIEENPDSLHAKALLIRVLQATNAEEDLKTALSDFPETEPTGEAEYVRATLFARGDVFEEDDEKFEILTQAAHDKGFAPATYELGLIWDNKDIDRQEKFSRSLDLYKLSGERGISAGYAQAGIHYYNGYGVDINYATAAEWYEKGASAGSAWAMNNLADMLEWGTGLSQDYGRAGDLYRQAYELGNYNAGCNLGEIYANAKGVEKNYKTAFDLFEDAANNGSATCMANLAWAYRYGRGTDQDYTLMRYWARKGAKEGSASANFYLGEIYRYGLGISEDYELAYAYFETASDKEDDAAAAEMADMHEMGLGVEQNDEKALELYELAIERENGWAMNRLGERYRDGVLVDKDLNKALELFFMAFDEGREEAVKNLENFKAEYGDDPSLNSELAVRLNSPKPDWTR